MQQPRYRPETIAIHGTSDRERHAGEPLIAPEVRSTVFRHPGPQDEYVGFVYTRVNNPNRQDLERVLARLEGGSQCAAFSSGMAAAAAVFQALNPGDRVLIPRDLYHGTRSYLVRIATHWGLDVVPVDMRSPGEVSDACRRGAGLVWLETPSNPLLHVSDIADISAIANRDGALVCVDNTWPSPINQQPLLCGADLVVHSSTKYIGGHSDVLGGAVVSHRTSAIFPRIREIQQLGGAVPSPNDCWMLVRSIKTLPYRIRGHNSNCMRVAEFLQDFPGVTAVHYPGLPSHPGHAVASGQMSGYGGMLAFEVAGGRSAALGVVAASRIIQAATSLGGVESTWEHRRSVEGPGSTTPEALIRFSVGLEHIDDLLEDLERALSRPRSH